MNFLALDIHDGATELPATSAILYRNMNIVRMLVDRQADLIHATDSDGDQPLHNAARGGHTDVVQFLLLEGADPCKKNKLGETPRQTAGKDIEPGIAEALIIAEKQWIATQANSCVPEPSTPPSSAQRKHGVLAEPGVENSELESTPAGDGQESNE
jgi:ankyrin repeat protein